MTWWIWNELDSNLNFEVSKSNASLWQIFCMCVCVFMCHSDGMDNFYFISVWVWACVCFYVHFSRMRLYYVRFISGLWRKAALFEKYFINLRRKRTIYKWRRRRLIQWRRRWRWQQQQNSSKVEWIHKTTRALSFCTHSNASLSYPLLSVCLSAFRLDLWFNQSHRIYLVLSQIESQRYKNIKLLNIDVYVSNKLLI